MWGNLEGGLFIYGTPYVLSRLHPSAWVEVLTRGFPITMVIAENFSGYIYLSGRLERSFYRQCWPNWTNNKAVYCIWYFSNFLLPSQKSVKAIITMMRVFFLKGFSVEQLRNAQFSLNRPDLPQVNWPGCSRWFGKPSGPARKCSFQMKIYMWLENT